MTKYLLSVILCALILGTSFFSNPQAVAQSTETTSAESSNSPEPTAEDIQFDELFTAWKLQLGKLYELQISFSQAKKSEQPALEAEFEKLLTQSRETLEQLKALGAKAIEIGTLNPDIIALTLFEIENKFSTGRYQEPLRSAELLANSKVGPEIPGLHAVIASAALTQNEFDLALKHAKLADPKDQAPPSIEEFNKFGGISENWQTDIEILHSLWQDEAKIRAQEAEADDLPRVKLETSKGDIVLELFENEAPNTVANFISLVKQGFYDGIVFHRVLQHFMAQGGDPTGTGSGGPGYSIPDEYNKPNFRRHFAGSLSMAKSAAPDSGGSQFFLTFRPTSGLDERHTVFGRVIEGMDVLGEIQRIDPENPLPNIEPDLIRRATVLRDRGHEYEVKKSR